MRLLDHYKSRDRMKWASIKAYTVEEVPAGKKMK